MEFYQLKMRSTLVKILVSRRSIERIFELYLLNPNLEYPVCRIMSCKISQRCGLVSIYFLSNPYIQPAEYHRPQAWKGLLPHDYHHLRNLSSSHSSYW